MAKHSGHYEIPYPLERVRSLLSDPRQSGAGLAFVEETEWHNGLPFWRLRPAMATITGSAGLLLDYQILPDDAMHWEGGSPRLISRGELRLAPAGPAATAIDFTLEMAGVGLASVIIEPLASLQIEGQMDHFIDRLEAALGLTPEKAELRPLTESKGAVSG